jgi:hypothetical protein
VDLCPLLGELRTGKDSQCFLVVDYRLLNVFYPSSSDAVIVNDPQIVVGVRPMLWVNRMGEYLKCLLTMGDRLFQIL